ncbi:MAG: DUF72 domain-containing protein, partial [Desulfobacula sp.]|nr:DUF72 domain-containing protein [Desulfobacula sp.]
KALAGGIFFNNHVRGQAVKNALTLIDLLLKNREIPNRITQPSKISA